MTTYHDETILAQLGNRSEKETGSVSLPLHLSTAFRHEGIGQSTGFDYTRTANPTRLVLEEGVAMLERGVKALAFSSGMAAISALQFLFKKGDHIIVSKDLYGGTYRLFEQYWSEWGIETSYSDFSSIEEVEMLVTTNTVALFIESPTNPLMKVVNIEEMTDFAKEKEIKVIVDNTFYTPLLQKPLEMGADIVIHSATKYLSGHNDVLAGLLITNDEEIAEKLVKIQNGMGAVLSPFDSFLLVRGMKTLSIRMKQHESNAKQISEFLEQCEDVAEVLYPGIGGMISFRLHDECYINPFLQSLQVISFAESLGGCESFITYPFTQTHADIPIEVRIERGVCQRLLRFSVGIEESNDIINDLQQAFQKMKKA